MNIVQAFPQKDTWLAQCLKSESGKPIPNVANVLIGLRCDPVLDGLFAFDEMSRLPMLGRGFGEPLIGALNHLPRPLTDDDVVRVQEFLQQQGLSRIARETVRDAIGVVARDNFFHPIRDYLRGLVWDGQPRVSTWLTTRLGAELTPYTQAIGRYFLIAMVARIAEPGCKADYMVVFETQRIGTADQRRISAAMERLGWQRGQKDYEGKRWWMK